MRSSTRGAGEAATAPSRASSGAAANCPKVCPDCIALVGSLFQLGNRWICFASAIMTNKAACWRMKHAIEEPRCQQVGRCHHACRIEDECKSYCRMKPWPLACKCMGHAVTGSCKLDKNFCTGFWCYCSPPLMSWALIWVSICTAACQPMRRMFAAQPIKHVMDDVQPGNVVPQRKLRSQK